MSELSTVVVISLSSVLHSKHFNIHVNNFLHYIFLVYELKFRNLHLFIDDQTLMKLGLSTRYSYVLSTYDTGTSVLH